MNNYKTLIIAGYGAVGKSIDRLGREVFESFEKVLFIDKNLDCPTTSSTEKTEYIHGDTLDDNLVSGILENMPSPAIFVNVCSSLDNLSLRRILSFYDVAYLDSCASTIGDEYRFSRLMPYTLTNINSRYPQWLCWGINPGLVEIIARKLMNDIGVSNNTFDVSVYEYDRLYAHDFGKSIAVGWCPDALVEEVMQSPTYQFVNGKESEPETEGSDRITAIWEGTPVESRIVGHEDIWNIGRLGNIRNSSFIYALHEDVMSVLEGSVDTALNTLTIPDETASVTGLEQVAVQVLDINSDRKQTLVWATDHAQTMKEHSVNAVQFQTSKSLLLAISLLQKTRYGTITGNFSASTLPINDSDWDIIDNFMDTLDITWEDGNKLNLCTI